MDNLVNLIGGYDSAGPAILMVVSLLGGAVLIALLKRHLAALVCGASLEVFGAIILLDLLGHRIETAPNMPEWSAIIMPLAGIAMIVGLAIGITRGATGKGGQDDEEGEDQR